MAIMVMKQKNSAASPPVVCLAQFPADANTQYYAVDHRDVPYYGIFQLSGHEWCNNGRHTTKNKCKTSCNNFLDDDIRDDAQCLKKALIEHGLKYWKHYRKNCTYAALRLYSFHCSYYFENDNWYKKLLSKGKGRRNSLTVHIHFPRN
ncbi:alpha-lactalbumin-like isoform X2 [Sceloporus undulatus]|uniref:alpha-lactalbumin-like isoform X2 n=1 Tax=Sceloporus undulatus TaxID=8520 RepID=UPI001C4DD1DD|nr:alpha-lactalbumin-like isoform X2 [Sceloporus undulatus]